MLAVVTAEPTALSRAIEGESEPFTALAGTHKDGWGIAYGDGPAALVRKSTAQALGDEQFDEAIDGAEGTRFMAHIRRASTGSALNMDNTHPFVDDRKGGSLVLSHHGQFAVTEPVREALTASVQERGGRTPVGGTDSELYFGLVTAHAHAAGVSEDSPLKEWALAVQRAAAEVTAATREHTNTDPEALNTLLLTPRGLVAYQQWDESLRGKYKARDTYELRYLVDRDSDIPRVLVASQGWDRSDYAPMHQGEALTVEAGTLDRHTCEPLPELSALD